MEFFGAILSFTGLDSYHAERTLPYTKKQLYDIVADINAYREYLPFCPTSQVLKGSSVKEPYEVEAKLAVGFEGINESYMNRITFKPYEEIRGTATSTTFFKSLQVVWRFQSAPNSSRTTVSVDVKYKFEKPAHAVIILSAREYLSEEMIGAFVKRCYTLYGQGESV